MYDEDVVVLLVFVWCDVLLCEFEVWFFDEMVEVVYVEGVGFGVVEWCVDVDVVVVGFCVFGYDVYCCDFVLCGVVYVGCDGCVKVW